MRCFSDSESEDSRGASGGNETTLPAARIAALSGDYACDPGLRLGLADGAAAASGAADAERKLKGKGPWRLPRRLAGALARADARAGAKAKRIADGGLGHFLDLRGDEADLAGAEFFGVDAGMADVVNFYTGCEMVEVAGWQDVGDVDALAAGVERDFRGAVNFTDR